LYCPDCGSKFVDGVGRCPDCDVELASVEPLAPERAEAAPDLIVVFSGSSADRLAVAKSLLMSEGIGFVVKGEGVQDLFGWGRFPAGFNVSMGPVLLLVDPEAAASARELLGGLNDEREWDETSEEAPDDVEPTIALRFGRFARLATKVVLTAVVATYVLALLAFAAWRFFALAMGR
jgi:hypothetical protein